MNAIRVLDLEQTKSIPTDRVGTYATVVVDFWSQKEDPIQIHITAGGNLTACPND